MARVCTVQRRSARRSWSTAGSSRSSCGSWRSIACSASNASMAVRCTGIRRSASIHAGVRRNDGGAAREFYVNAMTGELGHAVYGRLTFEEIPRKDAVRLEPLAAKSSLERLAAEAVNDAIPVAKVGPSQAQDIVRTTLGAKPTQTEPELVLLPMWRFDVRSNGAGRERTMWMEGTFGSVFDKSP